MAMKPFTKPKLKPAAAGKLIDDLIQEALNDLLDDHGLAARLFRDAIDKFLFCDGVHEGFPFGKSPQNHFTQSHKETTGTGYPRRLRAIGQPVGSVLTAWSGAWLGAPVN